MATNEQLTSTATNKVIALSAEDWSRLEYLYKQVIAYEGSFSETAGGQRLPSGAIEMPYTIEKPVVRDIRKFFLDKGLIVLFDWGRWDEGRAMFQQKPEDRFKDTSLEDTLRLFTAVIRNDRFCDGAWADLFESGDAAKLLFKLLSYRPISP